MAENKDKQKPPPLKELSSPVEDPDFYIRNIAAIWGLLDLIKDWIPHHIHEKGKVTDHVLFPAALYGQLQVVQYALKYGDLTMKDGSDKYPGWTLMHFAVEGAQRNMLAAPQGGSEDTENLVSSSPHDIVSGSPQLQPKTNEEVKRRQMEIIYILGKSGVPISEKNDAGHSPSLMALKQLDINFLEGAMLLDILAMMQSQQTADDQAQQLDTPGLSCFPKVQYSKDGVHRLIMWAYSGKHYDILQYCQKRKIADLSSPKLLVTLPEMVLRNQSVPLLMDIIHRMDFQLLQIILESSHNPSEVLTQMYEYSYHQNTKRKESVLSYACHKYNDGERNGGNQIILRSLLSPQIVGKHLSHINLSGVALRRLPPIIIHENLRSLDIRENNLDVYPSTGDDDRLNWNTPNLRILNISHNLFAFLHPDLFQLPSLYKLIASDNKIQDVPIQMWTAPTLKHLDLSNNLIQKLPCPVPLPLTSSFNLRPAHTSVTASAFSRLKSSGVHGAYRTGLLPSARCAYIDHDVETEADLDKCRFGFSLQTLDITGNRVAEIPKGLPCLAPLLHTLKLARNNVTDLGHVTDYPPFLQTLNAMNNGITRRIRPCFEATNISCLQSQLSTAPATCSHMRHENLASLKFLYLSNNRLQEIQIEYEQPNMDFSQAETDNDPPTTPRLLFPRLQGLRVSHNRLVELPENICKLVKLCELQFDGNTGIEKLPPKLYELTSLFTLKYEGISDPIVQELRNFKGAPEILYYLKARESKAQLNTSMRLFVIGHFCKGKTTLLEHLRCRSAESSFDQRVRRILNPAEVKSLTPQVYASTVGIECGKWECALKGKGSKNATKITFYTWDFAGQEEYYVTHQCFLTNRALYLLVWNVLDGEAGIESLSIWLQNMQARAQGFAHTVIIVGTHIDKIHKHEREQKCRKWAELLERYRMGRLTSKGYPNIKEMCFIGCPSKGKSLNLDRLNDTIYNIAMEIDSPRDSESKLCTGLKIKILEEKIPYSYELLRRRIEDLTKLTRDRRSPPVMERKRFCIEVKDIIDNPEEVETAVDFLYATTGVILHFKIPVIDNYYIIDPQRWFDLCALVISPDNVSSLVRNTGRPGDDRFGLLSSVAMNREFQDQGCDENISKLIRTFLHELHIIHQVNRDYCLVPSAIDPDPALSRRAEWGSFPRAQQYQCQRRDLSNEAVPSISALVINETDDTQLYVKTTGLIYRRMLLMPPIASGFWSKLIALFLQKSDFQQIIRNAVPEESASKFVVPTHRLRTMIGSIEVSWVYWKTGIILYANDTLILRVNSLHRHEFEDPQLAKEETKSVFSARQEQVKEFLFQGDQGWQPIPKHFKEVIEVIVPEIYIGKNQRGPQVLSPAMSAKILAKALEIVDEVLKNHCEHLVTAGIYSINDLLHIVPCPLCYGDKDERPQMYETQRPFWGSVSIDPSVALQPHLLPLSNGALPTNHPQQRRRTSQLLATTDSFNVAEDTLPEEAIVVFTVDACIKQTFTSDDVICPKHGPIEIEFLTPDLVFADLADVKLDKAKLSTPINRGDSPEARGSFGAVFRRKLLTELEGEVEVAVKIFDQDGGTLIPETAVELTKSYSDMRYELNKLSSLNHPFVVRFIGVFTNPHCFLLEWAPFRSLEHIRKMHETSRASFCPTSIFLTLLQVTSALAYLHSPREVGIVHRDLKNSNILVFKFPEVGHNCYEGEKHQGFGVLVKLTDMGICANPLAYKSKNLGGLRQFVPECVSSNTSIGLTEKVDIFSLGSCLYELMCLRRLPLVNMGEAEYRNMLEAGKRAPFYTKDPLYPILLFQLLEDCWQQEHFKRPSAESLCEAIKHLTGLNSGMGSERLCREPHSLLLDTYTLHQGYRVSASHDIVDPVEGTFTLCAGLTAPDASTTTIAVVRHNLNQELQSELQAESVGEVRNNSVTAVFMTPEEEILVGCSDGKLVLYDASGIKSVSDPSCLCTDGYEHREIVEIYYHTPSKLLVVGYQSGQVHINHCTQGLRNSLFNVTQWRQCCYTLTSIHQLNALKCISIAITLPNRTKGIATEVGATEVGTTEMGATQEVTSEGVATEAGVGSSDDSLECQSLEVWCGGNSNQLEVWTLPWSDSAAWTTNTIDELMSVVCVDVGSDITGAEVSVRRMKESHDGSKMVVVLQTSQASAIVLVDAVTKQCVKTILWTHSVASVLLTPTKLIMGSYSGAIYIYGLNSILESDNHLDSEPLVLKAHYNTVYSLVYLQGNILKDGSTSFFPTFVGKAGEDTRRDFLVSVGFGKGYPSLNAAKIFRTCSQQSGCYINAWLL